MVINKWVKFTAVTENYSGPKHKLGIELVANGNSAGEVNPGDCQMTLSHFDLGFNDQDWFKIIRHEMGHVVGMEHGGSKDNTSNPVATMSSCIAPTGWTSTKPLAKDQAQYLNYLHNGQLLRQYTANGGFETGINFFGSNNMETASSTIEYEGQRSIRLKGLAFAYNSYINQTSTVWHGSTPLPGVKTEYWMRESSSASSVTTLTKTRISARKATDEGSGFGCDTDYPFPGLDPNKLDLDNIWVVLSDNSVNPVTTGTSWQRKLSGYTYPANFSGLNGAEGLRLQMKVYGRSMSSTNERLYFYADNVRLEGFS